MNSNHIVQKCKVCRKELKIYLELVCHVAKEHHEDEKSMNVQLQSTPKSDGERKNTKFALSESMLDGV